jgi:hypothetical protein
MGIINKGSIITKEELLNKSTQNKHHKELQISFLPFLRRVAPFFFFWGGGGGGGEGGEMLVTQFIST